MTTYPSWRYHATDEPRIIHSADEEHPGWADSPAVLGSETAPGAEPDPEIAARAVALRADAELNETPTKPQRKRRK